MKMKWILTTFATACLSLHAQNDAAAIQQLVDQLPAGRESIATVTLSGTYTLEQSVVLPDYTRLDLRE